MQCRVMTLNKCLTSARGVLRSRFERYLRKRPGVKVERILKVSFVGRHNGGFRSRVDLTIIHRGAYFTPYKRIDSSLKLFCFLMNGQKLARGDRDFAQRCRIHVYTIQFVWGPSVFSLIFTSGSTGGPSSKYERQHCCVTFEI